MQLDVKCNGEIRGYAKIGGFENGIEIDNQIVPEDFEIRFESGKYLYQNGLIILNLNWSDQEPKQPHLKPTSEQLMINQLGIQVAELFAQQK